MARVHDGLMHTRTTLLFAVLGTLTSGGSLGCTASHALPEPEPDLHAVVRPHGTAPVAAVVDLDSCFGGGGALLELGAVNNDDQADHGSLLTFGISPSGVVAAAGEDGTLKFWTMDATLVGEADPGVLTYGPELGGAPITDLAFTEDHAIAGDVRGLVQRLGAEGTADVLGGTMPDVPIASVAFDRAAQRLAHAQGDSAMPDVARLVVGTLDGAQYVTLSDTLASITDLAFTPEGVLVIGGTEGARAALELRDGADPTRIVARLDVGDDARVVEVAAAREGAAIVVATTNHLYAIDGERVRLLGSSDVALRSVDLTPSGDHAFTVDASGTLIARSTADGVELARTSITAGFGVRIDATGQRIVVGATDAMLHVLACSR